MTFPVVIFTRK